MAQGLVLGDERRGDVLRDHEPRVEPFVPRDEERRQAVGEARVHEPLRPPLADARELGAGDREAVEPHRNRLPVEVPVRDDQPFFQKDERVVRRGVQLDCNRALDVGEKVRLAPCTWGAHRSE